MSKRWLRRPPPPLQALPQPRVDPVEVQAFVDQARWLLGQHAERSSGVSTRAGVLLGFIGVMTALLPAGATLAKGRIDFTLWIEINAGFVMALLVIAAGFCLATIKTRKATVQNADQLRKHWHRYATGGPRGLVLAQIAHSYLGGSGDLDPIAMASQEADSRARCSDWALYAAAVIAGIVLLTCQILTQQM